MVTGVEELTVAAVVLKVVEVAPCGIVTDAGMFTAATDFESVTTTPPDGAAAVSCTVAVPD